MYHAAAAYAILAPEKRAVLAPEQDASYSGTDVVRAEAIPQINEISRLLYMEASPVLCHPGQLVSSPVDSDQIKPSSEGNPRLHFVLL